VSTAQTTTGPALFEQGILSELLATDSFDLAVGRNSALKASVSGATARARNNAIEAAVAAGAGSESPGPQVLLITFTGASPSIAQSTLSSLIAELQKSTARYGQDYGQTATSYYTTQLAAADSTQTKARDALASYHRAHPGSTSANDPAYAQLSAALTTASAQVASTTQSLNQARAEARLGVLGATVRVADSPSLPTSATESKKKEAAFVVGAGIGGALLDLLIVIALTKGEADPLESEVSRRPAPFPALGSPQEPEPRYATNGHRNGTAVSTSPYATDHHDRDEAETRRAGRNSIDVDAPVLRRRFGRPSEDREPV
jgi:hypothetical protein